MTKARGATRCAMESPHPGSSSPSVPFAVERQTFSRNASGTTKSHTQSLPRSTEPDCALTRIKATRQFMNATQGFLGMAELGSVKLELRVRTRENRSFHVITTSTHYTIYRAGSRYALRFRRRGLGLCHRFSSVSACISIAEDMCNYCQVVVFAPFIQPRDAGSCYI